MDFNPAVPPPGVMANQMGMAPMYQQQQQQQQHPQGLHQHQAAGHHPQAAAMMGGNPMQAAPHHPNAEYVHVKSVIMDRVTPNQPVPSAVVFDGQEELLWVNNGVGSASVSMKCL